MGKEHSPSCQPVTPCPVCSARVPTTGFCLSEPRAAKQHLKTLRAGGWPGHVCVAKTPAVRVGRDLGHVGGDWSRAWPRSQIIRRSAGPELKFRPSLTMTWTQVSPAPRRSTIWKTTVTASWSPSQQGLEAEAWAPGLQPRRQCRLCSGVPAREEAGPRACCGHPAVSCAETGSEAPACHPAPHGCGQGLL